MLGRRQRAQAADPDPEPAQAANGAIAALPAEASAVRQQLEPIQKSLLSASFRAAPKIPTNANPMAVACALTSEIGMAVARGGEVTAEERARLAAGCMRCYIAVHPYGLAPEPEERLIQATVEWAAHWRKNAGVMSERRLMGVLARVAHLARRSMMERQETLVRGNNNIAYADSTLQLGGALLIFQPLLEPGVPLGELQPMI